MTRKNSHVIPRERGVVGATTVEVLNILYIEGYKHVLVLKHSDAK